MLRRTTKVLLRLRSFQEVGGLLCRFVARRIRTAARDVVASLSPSVNDDTRVCECIVENGYGCVVGHTAGKLSRPGCHFSERRAPPSECQPALEAYDLAAARREIIAARHSSTNYIAGMTSRWIGSAALRLELDCRAHAERAPNGRLLPLTVTFAAIVAETVPAGSGHSIVVGLDVEARRTGSTPATAQYAWRRG